MIEEYSTTFGYVLESTINRISWPDFWIIDHDARLLTLPRAKDLNARNEFMATTLSQERERKSFKVSGSGADELYPVYCPRGELVLSIERAAASLFGIVTYAVHMITYVNSPGGLQFWVPRRSATKNSYPGMLDNSVGGSVRTGERPIDCLIREAEEEASLPEDLVKEKVQACGVLTYFLIWDERAGGETGLLEPQVQYVYEMEIASDVIPTPGDGEAESFQLMDLESIKTVMCSGEFKPNCVMTILDFFIRHGILNAENEKDYIEIVSRLHRKLEFPTI